VIKKEKSIEKDKDIEKYLKIYTKDDVFLNENPFEEKYRENSCEKAEKTEDSDKELGDSMLLSTLLQLSACFLKLSHYKEALFVLEDAGKIAAISSQILFRESQALGFNKESSSFELEMARKKINKAMFIVKKEPIFQKKFKGILGKLDLENVEEIYEKQAVFVGKRLFERKNEEKSAFSCKKQGFI